MPIYHDLIPRTPEWIQARLGIPTASEFHRIVTAKGKLSAQSVGYMHRLLAEWILGQPVENWQETSQWMQRGTDKEDEAIAAYEFQTDTETKPGGFITTDDGLVGCSPDRLVGEDGDLEIKAGLAQTQVGYLLSRQVDEEYRCQLQGRLWITGRKWVDLFAYHPTLPHVLIRVPRDEEYIATLGQALRSFVEIMLRCREELTHKYGPFVRPQPEPDHSKDWITDQDIEEVVARARERKA